LPNLPAHIYLAHHAAKRLGHRTLEEHLGCFLLGATSPDVRVITRRRREEYHFAPLDFDAVGAGVKAMFLAHPHLSPSLDHDAPTQAFVAGYMTHLFADEIWITQMYRPYFGNPNVFGDDVLGKVLDRALQLELDREAWETLDATRAQLQAASDGFNTGIIPSETLSEWKKWILSSFERGFTWDRLQFMARRIAGGDDAHPAHRLAEEFLRDAPQGLDDLYDLVPRRSVADYKERTIETLVDALGNYLP